MEVVDAGPNYGSAQTVEFPSQFVGKPCLARSVRAADPHANV